MQMKVSTIDSALRSANARKIERIRRVSRQHMSAGKAAWQKRIVTSFEPLQAKRELLAIQPPSKRRIDYIEQLRKAIMSGTYCANSQEIVNRMLEDQRSFSSMRW
jgi:anti-sigma28 factor (negative regulator of flagellin synthesis)